MAVFPISVVIDPSGARTGAARVKQELSGVDQAAKQVTDSIKRAFLAIGASLGVREVVKLADSFTFLTNQLRTVTNGTTELKNVTKQLFDVANDTRSAVDVTALAYTRFSRALHGVPQKEVLDFTRSVNEAIQTSGATAQEARAGLIQFSQGLAAGALRGDEFRSVTEQLHVIVDVLKENLGKTEGEIRKMADSGQLTGKIIFDAFKKAGKGIHDEFGNVIPTISGQLQVLRNSLIQFLGSMQPLFKGLGAAIRFVADNFTVFATIIGTLLIPVMLRLIATTAKWIALQLKTVWLGLLNISSYLIAALSSLSAGMVAFATTTAGALVLTLGITAAVVALGVAIVLAVVHFDDIVDAIDDAREATINWLAGYDPTPLQESIFYVKQLKPALDQATAAVREWRSEMDRARARTEYLDKLKDDFAKVAAELGTGKGNAMAYAQALGILNEAFEEDLIPTQEEFIRLQNELRAEFDKAGGVFGKVGKAYLELNERLIPNIKNTRELAEAEATLAFAVKHMGVSMEYAAKLLALLKAELNAEAIEKAREATKKFREEWRSFTESISPTVKLMNEYDELLKLLDEGMRRGVIKSQEEYNELLRQGAIELGKNLEAASKPDKAKKPEKTQEDLFGETLEQLNQELELLKLGTAERERAADVIDFSNKLEAAGFDANSEKAMEQMRTIREARIEIQKVEAAGISADYINGLENELRLVGLTKNEREIEQAVMAYTAALEAKGVEATQAQLDQVRSLVQARQAEQAVTQTQQQQQQATVQLAQQFTSTIVDAAFEADQSFGKMFGNLMKDFAKAIIQALILKAILTALGVPMVGGASGSVGTLLGFAKGGGFTVGGGGGTDSQVVAFRATPGEHVEVRTPEQFRSGSGVGANGNISVRAMIVRNEHEAINEYMRTPSGERAVIAIMDKHRKEF